MNEPPSRFGERAQRTPSFVLSGLFVLAGLYTLYFARAVLIPVVLAVLLSWILAPAVRGLRRLPAGALGRRARGGRAGRGHGLWRGFTDPARKGMGRQGAGHAAPGGNQAARYQGVGAGSAGLGVVAGLALHWLGMPNAVLWAVMIAVLNYVPYLGAALCLIVLTPVAILSIEPLGQALLVPAVFLVLNIIEGELLTAVVVGKYFTLNPVIVFLGILFWGWLWGVVGALVAVPLLVSFRIFCTYVPTLRPLCGLMGDEPRSGQVGD